MSTAYYLRSRGKVLGPFPIDRLQVMKSRGQLGRTHQVSTDRQTWVAAGSLPELFEGPPSTNFEPAEDETTSTPAAASATPSAAGPSAPTAAWFYHAGGQQFGPVTAAELRRMLSTGGLVRSDMVWREGMESWAAIGDVPELFVAPDAHTSRGGLESSRRRRSASAVTALSLSIAPWPLYAIGMLAFLLAVSGMKNRQPTGEDVLALAVGAGFFGLVLHFAWFVLSLLAVIFGGIGVTQISQSDGRLLGHGMAVAGLVLGIVNIVVQFLWIPLGMVLRAT